MIHPRGTSFFALLLFLASTSAPGAGDCDGLFALRDHGKEAAETALRCYEEAPETAKSLTQRAYLEFFIAEYFTDEKNPLLLEAIAHAEEAVLLFGPKYGIPEYEKLAPTERKALAAALYTYGLATSRYIDLAGKWEAIKRMNDIRRSMDSILRIGEEATAFFGADRTLGIFHTKVPEIAGGKIELAERYLTSALESTRVSDDLSRYPANNIAYADLMHKIGKDAEGCRHLGIVAALTENDVRRLENEMYYESMIKVTEAKTLFAERKCAPTH